MPQQRVVMLDDRVEVFISPVLPGAPYQSYYAFEINKAGRALTNINQVLSERGGRSTFDRSWDGRAAFTTRLLDSDTMVGTLQTEAHVVQHARKFSVSTMTKSL
eukprot:SAG11_NODE_4156_length_2034_cov_2.781395_2_plen_104_part_00